MENQYDNELPIDEDMLDPGFYEMLDTKKSKVAVKASKAPTDVDLQSINVKTCDNYHPQQRIRRNELTNQ